MAIADSSMVKKTPTLLGKHSTIYSYILAALECINSRCDSDSG